MWTYMMAAARGDRANSMLSRRRNESESPKYGYNLSRPMYRTSRLNGPKAHSAAVTTYQYPGSTYGSSSSTSASQMFHTSSYQLQQHQLHQQQQLQQHQQQQQQQQQREMRLQCSAAGGTELNTRNDDFRVAAAAAHAAEEGTSLFSPLPATASVTESAEKETACLFRCRNTGNTPSSSSSTAYGCRQSVRKHLIANHVGEVTANAAVAHIHKHDGAEDDKQGAIALQRQTDRQSRGSWDDDDGDDDDDEDGDDEVEHDDDDDEDDENQDYLESVMENGKRISQDQSKRAKPSALRRTLNALRKRITKRSRAKPPDWFLEKFSNANNTDKIGQNLVGETRTSSAGGAAANDSDASEIRGTNALCNRLSVNPSLPSHYRWLAVVSIAVLYNIIFVVGRSVFWEINRRASPIWYILDYLCDAVYLVDTLVHMHEGYLEQGLLVRDAYKLRKHYFSTKGWTIDVVSMLPTDLAYIWWPPSTCSASFLPCPVIVRLNRLLRLPRMWEWFDRTETATGYPNAFRICKVVLAILVLIHWNACMYFAISYALGFGTDNWVYNLNGYRNNTLQRQYIYSFYWSTLTLTTIGETPTPENDAEYLFVVADFLAGVLIFATIVGNIGSMISNMNVARVEFQNRMDGVKQYMAFRRVGHELEARVIRWFAYTWSQSGALDEERVLAALPDKLKAEIAIQVHMDTLKQVRIFHDCEPGLLEALVLKLKLQVFSPGDYICRKGDVGKEMYIVKRGRLSVVADDGVTVFATLGAGSVFGEVSVLEIAGNRTGNRRTANVRSLGYSDLFCLAKRDLWETLSDYPEARATLTDRGCQLLRKDGLLDEEMFADSQRVHDSIEGGIEKLEVSVENLNVRLARLLAEYTASQAKIKQRLAKLELNSQSTNSGQTAGAFAETQRNGRTGRLFSLQPKKRPRSRPVQASKSIDDKQHSL